MGARDGGLLLFRIRGVPVLLAPSWWLGSVVITLLYAPLVTRLLPGTSQAAAFGLAAAFAVLLGVSVLAHEIGHCVVALRMGLPVRRVRLFLLGGISEVVWSVRRPGHEGLVAVAGPAVSALLAGGFGLLIFAVPDRGSLWLLVVECAVANLAVALFNLLPGLPLDGGRMLRAAVWAITGRHAVGTRVAVAGGAVVTALLAWWAIAALVSGTEDRWLRLGICLVTGWFVAFGAIAELRAERRIAMLDAELAAQLRP
jgi:Zn-dependent protease